MSTEVIVSVFSVASKVKGRIKCSLLFTRCIPDQSQTIIVRVMFSCEFQFNGPKRSFDEKIAIVLGTHVDSVLYIY